MEPSEVNENVLPHACCRACRGWAPVITMLKGLCADCATERRQKQKRKGYKNDDGKHGNDNDV